MKNQPSVVVRSADVIGKSVENLNTENLGSIEEIVLDKFSGEVRYVVLSFGGLLGMGDKYFAFPWKSFSYSKERETFILSVDKEKLKNSKGFPKDQWPVSDEWSQMINHY